MAIADYLTRLDSLRDQLADNLVEKGVSATQDESLTELIPKVLEITQGGGGGSALLNMFFCRKDLTGINEIKLVGGQTEFYLFTDTILKKDLSVTDFEVSPEIKKVEYMSDHELHVTLAGPTVSGQTVSIKATSNAYAYKTGVSKQISQIIDTHLRSFFGSNAGMTTLSSGYNDGGSYTLTSTDFPHSAVTFKGSFPNYPSIADSTLTQYTTYTVSGNFVNFGAGKEDLKINYRDASSYYIGWQVIDTDDYGKVLKIRWEGCSHYSNTLPSDMMWELYAFGNDDYMLYVEMAPTRQTDGEWKMGDLSYSKAEKNGTIISMYVKDIFHSEYEFVYNEMYDLSKHHAEAEEDINLRTSFIEHIGNHDKLFSMMVHTKHDDDSMTFHIPTWRYNGTDYSSITVNGNSWMGVTGENFTVNRRDAAIYDCWARSLILTDLNDLQCTKVVWKGASRYSSSIDQEWELYLFSNGDAMIHLTKLGSNQDGSYSFFGNNYKDKITQGGDCSFYRTNVEGTSWEIVQGTYDISKHHNV